MMSEQTWLAVVADEYGYVLDDETLRAWAEAIRAGRTGWAVPCEPPTQIVMVTGSRRPEKQSTMATGDVYKLPSSWVTDHQLFEIDVEDQEPAEILRAWERAQACAAGLNAANVR